MDLEREQTPAIKWDRAKAVFLMKRDPYVGSAVVNLSECQVCHITPVLKGRTDRCFDLRLQHVRCVIVDPVRESLFPPAT